MKQNSIVPLERIESHIYLFRGEKVMLDADLAELYGVETKALNRAVHRNIERFPSDFMFQLTSEEAEALRLQFGTGAMEIGIWGQRRPGLVLTDYHGNYSAQAHHSRQKKVKTSLRNALHISGEGFPVSQLALQAHLQRAQLHCRSSSLNVIATR